jgi:hypothetical protein
MLEKFVLLSIASTLLYFVSDGVVGQAWADQHGGYKLVDKPGAKPYAPAYLRPLQISPLGANY